MTRTLAARPRLPALGATRASSAARHVLLEALDRTVDERVRFRVGAEELVVGHSSGSDGCAFSVRVAPAFFDEVLTFGRLGLGEAYMRGEFVMETGRLEDFLTLLLRSRADREIRRSRRLALTAAAIQLRNRLRSRREAVQQHYDIGVDLFEAFLDSTLTYTCGYARSPEDDLETLQRNKMERICRKLRLAPGETVLDLGCGYGGLLMYAAEEHGISGVGVTISRAQHEWAVGEIRRRGLDDRVEVRLMDYENVSGTYDKVLAIGLLEHVPPSHYGRFARKVAGTLKASSIALVHAIGTSSRRSPHDPFIQKYVFPSSHQVWLPALVKAMEEAGFAVLDVENLKSHYALTALAWLERFRENRHLLDPRRYDETFCRMWEYWLSAGVAGARASDAALYQVLYHNDRARPIPLTRV